MTEYLTFTVQTSKWLMIDRLTDCQIVFGDVLDRKQTSPDYKIVDVFSRQIGFFQGFQWSTSLVKNLKFLLCLYLGKIGLGIVFGDVLDRK